MSNQPKKNNNKKTTVNPPVKQPGSPINQNIQGLRPKPTQSDDYFKDIIQVQVAGLKQEGNDFDFMDGFLNQGQDQGGMMLAWTKYWLGVQSTEKETQLVLYCYGKSGVDTRSNKIMVSDTYKEKYVEWYIKHTTASALTEYNETVVIRSFCLSRVGICKDIMNKSLPKLCGSKALVFFLTPLEIQNLILRQVQQVKIDTLAKAQGKLDLNGKMLVPVSLYQLLNTVNPKSIKLDPLETTNAFKVLDEIAGITGVTLDKDWSLADCVDDVQIPWRDKFAIYKSTSSVDYYRI